MGLDDLDLSFIKVTGFEFNYVYSPNKKNKYLSNLCFFYETKLCDYNKALGTLFQ